MIIIHKNKNGAACAFYFVFLDGVGIHLDFTFKSLSLEGPSFADQVDPVALAGLYLFMTEDP